jgi:hypothetical protein
MNTDEVEPLQSSVPEYVAVMVWLPEARPATLSRTEPSLSGHKSLTGV